MSGEEKKQREVDSTTKGVDAIRQSLEQEHGVGQVVVTKLHDNTGAVVVLPIRADGKTNAQIHNVAGDVRCEIEIPESFRGGNGFADAYYANGELIAIFVRPGRDFAFVINERSGRVIKTYETR
jgi:hypothetical protein